MRFTSIALPVDGGNEFVWTVDGLDRIFLAPEGTKKGEIHEFSFLASVATPLRAPSPRLLPSPAPSSLPTLEEGKEDAAESAPIASSTGAPGQEGAGTGIADASQEATSEENAADTTDATQSPTPRFKTDNSWIGVAADGSGDGPDLATESESDAQHPSGSPASKDHADHVPNVVESPSGIAGGREVPAVSDEKAALERVQDETAAAKDKAVDEARAEAFARITQARERERATADEYEAREMALLDEQLEIKLRPDYEALLVQENEVRGAIEAADAEAKDIAAELERVRAKATDVEILEEKRSSTEYVMGLVASHQKVCTGCHDEVAEADEAVSTAAANELGIAMRVEVELKESEARADTHASTLSGLEESLAQLMDVCKAEEKAAEEALTYASSKAAALELERHLAARTTTLHEKESATRVDGLAEAEFALREKQARADTTEQKVKELNEKLKADRAELAVLTKHEANLEADEKNAVAGAARVAAAFDADDAATAQLSAVQQSYGEHLLELIEDPNTPSTQKTLIGRTRDLVRSQQLEIEACAADIASRRRAHELRAELLKKERLDTLCSLRAKRKAIEIAMAERVDFTSEVESQLAAEQQTAKAAAATLYAMEACLETLATATNAAKIRQANAAEAAEAAKLEESEAVRYLKSVRGASKQRVAEVRLRIVSETVINQRLEDYNAHLKGQLKTFEAMQEAASEPSPLALAVQAANALVHEAGARTSHGQDEEPQSLTIETLGQTLTYYVNNLRSSLSANSPSSGRGADGLDTLEEADDASARSHDDASTQAEPASVADGSILGLDSVELLPGKIGQELIAVKCKALAEWAADLKGQHVAVVGEIKQLRDEMRAAEKHAANEVRRLHEQRAAHLALLSKLEAYRHLLEVKSPRGLGNGGSGASPRGRSPPSIKAVARDLTQKYGDSDALMMPTVADGDEDWPREDSARDEAIRIQINYIQSAEADASRKRATQAISSSATSKVSKVGRGSQGEVDAKRRDRIESLPSSPGDLVGRASKSLLSPAASDVSSEASSAEAFTDALDTFSDPIGGNPTQSLGPDNDMDPRINPDVQPRWRSQRK